MMDEKTEHFDVFVKNNFKNFHEWLFFYRVGRDLTKTDINHMRQAFESQQAKLDIKDKDLYDKDMYIQTLEEQIQGLKINDYALCEYANDKDKEIENLRLSLQEAIRMHVDSCKF